MFTIFIGFGMTVIEFNVMKMSHNKAAATIVQSSY